MSQHDFDITTADANTGVAYRAAVNSALQALVSCNSGSTEPVVTYAYQFWMDTSGSSPVLKIRNNTNTDWLNFYTYAIKEFGKIFGYSTSVGESALYSNTIGAGNSAFGCQAMLANTTGSSNSAFGYQAMLANTTGSSNSAFGSETLIANTSGGGNCAVGLSSMYRNTTGNLNTAIGQGSYDFGTTGNNNTCLGSFSGSKITTGSQNTFIGSLSGYNTSQLITAVNSIAIGYNAYTTANNQCVLGNSSITETILRGRVKMPTPNIQTSAPPATATATGTTGDIAYDSNYVYVCVATNTWKRSALSTW